MKLGKYKHFKNKYYQVIGVARDSETLEEMVVYIALWKHKDFGENSLWVRSKKQFLEKVLVNGKEKPRFTPINN